MILLLLVLGLSTYFLARFYSKVKALPPGPTPVPLLGNLPQMALNMFTGRGTVGMLQDYSKKYGNVYTLWLGPMPTVHICDVATAHEAMIKKGTNFVKRPFIFLFDLGREGKGVISSNGQLWTEQRRFALHTLRNFGLGRNLMQNRIMLEVDYRFGLLEQVLSKKGGKMSLDPASFFELTVGNIINRLLFTERFTDEKEKEFFSLKRALDEATEKGSPIDLMITKWNANFFPFKSRLDIFQPVMDSTLGFIRNQILQRKSEIAAGTRNISGEPEDFVDAFLQEMEKADAEASFNEEGLAITLFDLWIAGQETTATTLYWAFAYLLSRPETLVKLQAEIDTVTGRRPLELTDKPKTPFLNAVITETLRLSQIVPINMMRDTEEDTIVGEFNVPKGTAVAAELSVIMSDPQVFDEPKKFKPERFVGTNLESKVLPFGLGKRACLGESLARAELYLIIGNFVGTYNISPDLKHSSSTEPISECSISRKARPYQMIVERRV